MKQHMRAIGQAFDQLKTMVGEAVGERAPYERAIATRTGVTSLDLVLGGGLPPGIVEIYGKESTGKTTLIGSILRTAQAQNLNTVLLPSEHHEVEFLKDLGVDPARLLLVQTQSPTEAFNAMVELLTQPRVVAVIDSITGLQGGASDETWSRLRWDFLSRVGETMSRKSCLVVVSQVRTKKSADPRRGYTQDVESANRRLSDLFTIRVELRRQEVTETSYEMLIDVVTNLYGTPAVIVEVPVEKRWGIRYDVDFLRTAVMLGVVQQVGAWYYLAEELGDAKFGPGVDKAAAQLMNNNCPWKKKVLGVVYP